MFLRRYSSICNNTIFKQNIVNAYGTRFMQGWDANLGALLLRSKPFELLIIPESDYLITLVFS